MASFNEPSQIELQQPGRTIKRVKVLGVVPIGIFTPGRTVGAFSCRTKGVCRIDYRLLGQMRQGDEKLQRHRSLPYLAAAQYAGALCGRFQRGNLDFGGHDIRLAGFTRPKIARFGREKLKFTPDASLRLCGISVELPVCERPTSSCLSAHKSVSRIHGL